jgi:hypothetical protein
MQTFGIQSEWRKKVSRSELRAQSAQVAGTPKGVGLTRCWRWVIIPAWRRSFNGDVHNALWQAGVSQELRV